MRGHWPGTALLALTLISGIPQGHATEDAATPDTIDLQATAALVNRWGSRPSFPESVTFAYYHVYMARALGQEITAETASRIIEYIVSCQQPDGGFTPKPAHTTTSNVIYTHYALKTLALLGRMKAIDKQAAVGFLLARVQQGGGITATAREGEQPNLATTFYGIESLRLLDAVDLLDKMQIAAFIERYREKGRGYTRVEGGISIPQSTFMGVRSLLNLGILTNKTASEVRAYLKGTRYSGLIQKQDNQLPPNIEALASTLEALAVLAALQEIDADRIHGFISSLYVPVNGGFGPRPGLGTTPPATYHAILSLVRLGELPDPVPDRQTAHPVKLSQETGSAH
jgi:prenyltransferase beta subunit